MSNPLAQDVKEGKVGVNEPSSGDAALEDRIGNGAHDTGNGDKEVDDQGGTTSP